MNHVQNNYRDSVQKPSYGILTTFAVIVITCMVVLVKHY